MSILTSSLRSLAGAASTPPSIAIATMGHAIAVFIDVPPVDGAALLDGGRESDWNIRHPLDTGKSYRRRDRLLAMLQAFGPRSNERGYSVPLSAANIHTHWSDYSIAAPQGNP